MKKWVVAIVVALLLASAPVEAQNDASVSGNLAGSGQTVVLDLDGFGTAAFQITGTWTATALFEATVDGTNWFPVNVFRVSDFAAVTSSTANGEWMTGVAGYQRIRVRAFPYTSGTAVVNIRAAAQSQPIPVSTSTPSAVTVNNGAGGSAVNVQDGGNSITTDGPPTTSTAATLSALGNTVQHDPGGHASAGAFVETSDLVGTIIFEHSPDGGVTWRTGTVSSALGSLVSTTVNPSAGQEYTWMQTGTQSRLRVRVSAYTSGSATVRIISSTSLPFNVIAPATVVPGLTQSILATQVAGMDSVGVAQALQTRNAAPASTAQGLVTRQVGMPAAAALADDTANPTLTQLQTFQMVWDSGGTNWDRMTQPLTDAQLRASPVPISAASLPLPTGAATSANQTNGTQQTQIVEGGATANITGTSLDVNVTASALPTGAATSANQTNGSQITQSRTQDGAGNSITSTTNNGGRGINVASGLKSGTSGNANDPIFPIGGLDMTGGAPGIWQPFGSYGGDLALTVQLRSQLGNGALTDNISNSVTDIDRVTTFQMVWDSSGANWDRMTQPLTDAQLRASPVPVSSTDLDIRNLVFATDKVDVSNSLVGVAGVAADGSPVLGNPVRVAGKDDGGNTQDVRTDTDGNVQVDVVRGAETGLVSGTLGALNDDEEIDVSGFQSIGFSFRTSSLVGTVVIETTSNSGATWDIAVAHGAATVALGTIVNPAVSRYTLIPGGHVQRMRLRVLAYTSGSAVVDLVGSTIATPFASSPALTIPGSWTPTFAMSTAGVDGSNVPRHIRTDSDGDVRTTATDSIRTSTTMHASISGTGTGTPATVTGYGSAIIEFTPTSFNGVVTLQGTADGTNWVLLKMTQLGNTALISSVISPTTLPTSVHALWRVPIDGLLQIRANVASYTSGTAVITAYYVPGPAVLTVEAMQPATQTYRTLETAAGSPTVTSVAASATSVTCLSANSNRMGATVYNDSTATLYVKFGATASTTSFTYKLFQDGALTVPYKYSGVIDCIWSSATGSARVTEVAQ